MFNVGQIIVLPDGKVKNKELWERAEENRKAREAGIELPTPAPVEGINPERMPLIKGGVPLANPTAPAKKLSNKQKQRLAASLPKPVPPRPILPDGISIPDGEENLIALFDITDEDIQKRLSKAKGAKKTAAKQLRRVQQEQKKFNKAMKIKKKQAANKGEIWDPIKAKKEVLGDQEAEEAAEKAEKAENSDLSSSSGSDSDSDSDSESDNEEEAEKPKSNKSKRRAEDDAEDEPQAKKSKKSKSSEEPEKKNENGLDFDFVVPPLKKKSKTIIHRDVPKVNLKLIQPEGIEKTVRKHIKQARKDAKRAAEAIAKAEEKKIADNKAFEAENARRAAAGERLKTKSKVEVVGPPEEAHLKKKAKRFLRQQREAEAAKQLALEQGVTEEELAAKAEEEKRIRKERKIVNKAKQAEIARLVAAGRGGDQEASTGEQWNANALTGDAARKDKFLRLMGAGKQSEEGGKKTKKAKKDVDIEKVQSELERQYESGMKMKHDGGGKRRGLGA